MRYLSLFSGIGGFELGIQKAYENYNSEKPGVADKKRAKGIRKNSADDPSEHGRQPPACIGFSEVDKYAIQIYQKHFKEHKNYGDITKIKPDTIPDFDLLVGGFPCQAFSIAGHRKGFDDTRGTLFFDIARILKEKRPRNFVLENVKGLLSHDKGRTFKTIIATLTELGYCVEWQVLNAKDFGVPQNRERVFIVGHFGGIPGRKVFPIFESDGVPKEGASKGSLENQSSTITKNYHKGVHSGGETYIKVAGKLKGGRWDKQQEHACRVYDTSGIAPTIPTAQGGNTKPKIIQRARGKNTGGVHAISPTISSNSFEHNNHVETLEKIRRLTPLECERLMSYPDNWTAGISDTQRYKTLGNGIVSNVVAEVVRRLYYEKE